MKVLKNKKNENIVSLEIEIGLEQLNKSFETAFKKMVKHARIPGFRKGKVPRSLFEKEYGKEYIAKEGIPEAVNVAYFEALKELSINPIDYPKNVNIGEYKENTPVTFSCEVEVKPDVKLGKYKGLKIEKEKDYVTEAELNAEIEKLQDQWAEFQSAERDAKEADIVRIHVDASVDEVPYAPWTRQGLALKIGSSHFSPAFDKEIVGLKLNESKEFSVSYDAEFSQEEIKNKTVAFKVTLIEVREKKLPELTDEFAKKASSEKFETLAALKEDLRNTLNKQAKENSEMKLKEGLINTLVEDSNCIVPEVLVQKEIEQQLKEYENNMKRSGFSLAQYLGITGKTMDEFKESLKEDAQKQVKTSLVLEALTEELNTELTTDEVKTEYKKLLPEDKQDEVDKYFEALNLDSFKDILKQRRSIDFLVENAKITQK